MVSLTKVARWLAIVANNGRKPDGCQIRKAHGRLRHWIALDALPGVGPRPGSGRTQSVGWDGIRASVILNRLADAGLPAEGFGPIGRRLLSDPLWNAAVAGADIQLQLTVEGDHAPRALLTEGRTLPLPHDSLAATINLSIAALLRALSHAEASDGA